MNKIFIPLSFLNWDFEFYTFCLFFPIFKFPNIPMLFDYPNHIHVTVKSVIHVNAWSYVSFFFHFEIYCTIFSILLYRSVCMLTKFTTNLNSIWSSLAYFFLNLWQSFSHKKKIQLNLVRFQCLFKFCEINVVCYKDIKTNSKRFYVSIPLKFQLGIQNLVSLFHFLHSLNAPFVFIALHGTFLWAVNPPFNFVHIFEGDPEKKNA